MPSVAAMIRLSLNLVPFAGIAFLWFIGVLRDQLGAVEDRLFSSVFLGSGVLFLAMLFMGAVTSTSLMGMLDRPNLNVEIFAYGRSTTRVLISVYAMRMAAVFTLSVSTVGLRTAALPALGLLPRIPRWSDSDGGRGAVSVEPIGLSRLGPPRQPLAALDSSGASRPGHHIDRRSHAERLIGPDAPAVGLPQTTSGCESSSDSAFPSASSAHVS